MTDAPVLFSELPTRSGARIGVATLNAEKSLNSLTLEMIDLLAAQTRAWAEDLGIAFILLEGAGDRAFCAGADLSSGGKTFNSGERDPEEAVGGELVLPWQIRKPVVAAINGHAVGVGITYPLCADLRFVAEDAKCQFAFVRRGMKIGRAHV